MPLLLFDRAYSPLLLSGVKTTTIRRWKRPWARPGQTVPTSLGLRLRIVGVETVALDALTDEDARRDGFPDRAALLAQLERRYGGREGEWYRITFSLVRDEGGRPA